MTVVVQRIRAGGLPVVEERDDVAVVRLVHASDASARQEPAGQTAKDTHGGFLDRGRAREVT